MRIALDFYTILRVDFCDFFRVCWACGLLVVVFCGRVEIFLWWVLWWVVGGCCGMLLDYWMMMPGWLGCWLQVHPIPAIHPLVCEVINQSGTRLCKEIQTRQAAVAIII